MWLARARGISGFKKTVVLKTMLPSLRDDPHFMQMFVNEARLAAALNHSNIVQIFDLGKIAQHYFIAMEFIDGKTVRQVKRVLSQQKKSIPLWLVLYIVSSVCNALEHTHNFCAENGAPLNIVHRDVSPENIMISFQGGVKMLDFGIATASLEMTADDSRTLRGKFFYMAPESIQSAINKKDIVVDHRTDIYSLGVVLYEMLTGVLPFKAADLRKFIKRIIKEDPVPPSKFVKAIPNEIEEIVMRALLKDPQKRYQSSADLRRDIDQFLAVNGFYPTEWRVAEFMNYVFDTETGQPRATVDPPAADAPEEKTPRSNVTDMIGRQASSGGFQLDTTPSTSLPDEGDLVRSDRVKIEEFFAESVHTAVRPSTDLPNIHGFEKLPEAPRDSIESSIESLADEASDGAKAADEPGEAKSETPASNETFPSLSSLGDFSFEITNSSPPGPAVPGGSVSPQAEGERGGTPTGGSGMASSAWSAALDDTTRGIDVPTKSTGSSPPSEGKKGKRRKKGTRRSSGHVWNMLGDQVRSDADTLEAIKRDDHAISVVASEAKPESRQSASAPAHSDDQNARALALFDEGLEHAKTRNYQAAVAAWEEACRLEPENRRYKYNLDRLRDFVDFMEKD